MAEDTYDLKPLFQPSSVAVVGASGNFGKWGQLILTNIVAGDFPGEIFPVNPKGGTLCGHRVYTRVSQVPAQVDLAFITTPAETVPSVVADCAAKGVKGLVVITSGFSETDGAGRALEKQVASTCEKARMLLVGPNTMGLICPYAGLFATGSHTRPRKGHVALVSQSGNLGNQLTHWAAQQGIGLSLFVGSGNEAMLTCPDYLDYLDTDPNTRIVVMYLEGVGEGKRFLSTARRVNKKKPIIILKGGRTRAGRIAASSHTGSLSGENSIFRAACRQAGVLNVRLPWELLDLSAAFSSLPLPRGRRVGIVTLGGGWGVVTADACNEWGLEVPELPGTIIETIDPHLPPFWSRGNPVDLVGTRDPEAPLIALEALLGWEGIDAVISLGIVGRQELVRSLIRSTRKADREMSPDFLEQIANYSREYENRYVTRITGLMEKYNKPVLGVSLTTSGEGIVRHVEESLYEGVFYPSPENAVNVLARMVEYQEFINKGEERVTGAT